MTPRMDMIGVAVRDMAASLAFYRRLGLEIPDGAESEAHVEATAPGGLRVAWDTVEVMQSFDPGWAPATGGAAFSLAFLVDSPAEVDSLYAELTGAGHAGHLAPWDAFWGQRYAVVRDPDGNDVALFAAL
jgi:catechol 2,3-dioxygenase-like lactoylglutathione lyase family enzyme